MRALAEYQAAAKSESVKPSAQVLNKFNTYEHPEWGVVEEERLTSSLVNRETEKRHAEMFGVPAQKKPKPIKKYKKAAAAVDDLLNAYKDNWQESLGTRW